MKMLDVLKLNKRGNKKSCSDKCVDYDENPTLFTYLENNLLNADIEKKFNEKIFYIGDIPF